MENKNYDTELDALIRASMKITEAPSPALNNSLKATLYQQEALLRRQVPTRSISLWYLPMILHAVTFGLLAMMALILIDNPYLSPFAAGLCLYIGLAGIFVTVLGIKRTALKQNITIIVKKRGVIA